MDEATEIEGIFVPLTDREQEALIELAQMQDLSPERVMVQALRMFQMVQKGVADFVLKPDEDKAFGCPPIEDAVPIAVIATQPAGQEATQ